ncbi:AMP-dependent synthetase/ligase [Neofusicoccum parvum]|uniref:AMP-dependent synthetase/ligase n=1 Tax=Neofusicoccum parvum TaxID=310453 RepID=A0ACB5S6Z2_9PEZI|nr:AMP-dependent synthetase/ligase [Neofusicoccum parvum]
MASASTAAGFKQAQARSVPLLPYAAYAAGAAATAAYLNARLNLTYDFALLGAFGRATIDALSAERADRISLFYVLESLARDPSTRDAVFLLLPVRPSTPAPRAGGDVRLERWTYGQVYAAALRHAGWLARAHGVRKGEVVALDMMNGARFVAAWFGAWALGAVPAFINYNLRGPALLHCLGVSTARLVLVGPEPQLRDKYDEVAEALANGDFGEATGAAERRVEVARFGGELDGVVEREEEFRPEDEQRGGAKLHDMGILIYTSGTTGLPKPAVVSWGKARAAAAFVGRWLPLKKGDVLYTCMPLYHTSASLLALLSTLSAHTTLALGHRFSATTLLADLHLTRATHLQYVGETLRYLLATPANPSLDTTHRVHTIFGNGLRPDVWRRFVSRFGVTTVAEFYAATEGPGGMWNKAANGFAAGAVGRNGWLSEALIWGKAQAAVRVDAASGRPWRDPATGRCARVGVGEAGELLYKLDASDICRRFQGYFNNDEATDGKVLRDVFEDGDAWFSTGDVLRRDAERRWWFVDRLGDTFRWKSENVSTAEVASLLGDACTDVLKEVVVYGVLVPGHDGRAGCAAAVLKDGGGGDGGEQTQLWRLAETAKRVLPKYAVPLFVRVTPALALTGTNKPQKHLLQKDGIDPGVVEANGDRLYWLRDGRYERFGEKEYARIQGGGVKL